MNTLKKNTQRRHLILVKVTQPNVNAQQAVEYEKMEQSNTDIGHRANSRTLTNEDIRILTLSHKQRHGTTR
jgi:hypothetical protein